MRVYISGPITGTKDYEERFKDAESFLKEQGHDAVNPVELGKLMREGFAEENKVPLYEDYLRGDIAMLLLCETIYMLKGWEKSVGACLEHRIATDLKMKIMVEEQ